MTNFKKITPAYVSTKIFSIVATTVGAKPEGKKAADAIIGAAPVCSPLDVDPPCT